jgi:DNA-binding transcriptional regulator YiaG
MNAIHVTRLSPSTPLAKNSTKVLGRSTISLAMIATMFGPMTGTTAVASGAPLVMHDRGQTSTPNFVIGTGRERRSDAVAPSVVVSDQEAISRLHELSGLTWEQLAKVFGVSRRTVHLWASGARLNAANSERLHRVLSDVERLPATNPDERRTALLSSTEGKASLYDRWRIELDEGRTNVNRSPWSTTDLLGRDQEAGEVNE